MKAKIFGIKDTKLGDITDIYFRQNEGIATREFIDLVNEGGEKSIISKHWEDFELVLLGSLDTNNGDEILLTENKVICRGANVHNDQTKTNGDSHRAN